MTKIETLLLKVPFVLFCSYVLKGLLTSVDTHQLGIITVLGVISCFIEYKQVDKGYALIEAKHKQVELDLAVVKEDLHSIKGALTSVKLTQGPRSTFGGK